MHFIKFNFHLGCVRVDFIRLMNKSACFGHSPAGSLPGNCPITHNNFNCPLSLNSSVPLYHTYSADVE